MQKKSLDAFMDQEFLVAWSEFDFHFYMNQDFFFGFSLCFHHCPSLSS